MSIDRAATIRVVWGASNPGFLLWVRFFVRSPSGEPLLPPLPLPLGSTAHQPTSCFPGEPGRRPLVLQDVGFLGPPSLAADEGGVASCVCRPREARRVAFGPRDGKPAAPSRPCSGRSAPHRPSPACSQLSGPNLTVSRGSQPSPLACLTPHLPAVLPPPEPEPSSGGRHGRASRLVGGVSRWAGPPARLCPSLPLPHPAEPPLPGRELQPHGQRSGPFGFAAACGLGHGVPTEEVN